MSAAELLRRNDMRLLTVMSTFSAADWAAPSQCAAWSNHEVLAHLVIGCSAGAGEVIREVALRRGSFDDANAALACRLALSRPPADLLDDFAGLMVRPRGLGRVFPKRLLLGDHVTHELDMLYGLGRRPDIAPAALAAVLDTQVAVPNPFVPAYRNSRGLRLMATDTGWTHGRGPTVRGRAAELVSALGNRPGVLGRLAGDGVGVLSARVGGAAGELP